LKRTRNISKYRRKYNISLRCILSVILIISLSLFSSSSSPYLLPFIMQGKAKETTLVLPAAALPSSLSSSSSEVPVEYSTPDVEGGDAGAGDDGSHCVNYGPSERLITISCKSAVSITDVYNQLNSDHGNNGILDKDQQQPGVWILNANLTINSGATLNIDSKDTKWLKIVSDGKTLAYAIRVYGSLKIDSVKLTSWNPQTNDYVQTYGSRESSGKITHVGAPRPYIRIEEPSDGTAIGGTTNITNSEIAYLGYEGGWGTGTSGIHYHMAGHGSVIRNNNIHHLYFGFYSVGVGGMVIENNRIHDMGHYGIDPHTGTHDMIIRNNTVYGNNGTAIICSLDCYNILFEKNIVYNNTGSGIAFSRNVTNSIAKDNYIYDQPRAIHISKSHNNEIYNNTISNSTSAISLISGSSSNKIYDNNIANAKKPLRIDPGLEQTNTIYSNRIVKRPAADPYH
jgi:parallel beta-helix repeat protein